MRRALKVLAIAGATLGLTAGPALAANPPLVGQVKVTQSGNSLTVSDSIAGLGNVDEATFTLEGTVDVFSRCYNREGNSPKRTTSRRRWR